MGPSNDSAKTRRSTRQIAVCPRNERGALQVEDPPFFIQRILPDALRGAAQIARPDTLVVPAVVSAVAASVAAVMTVAAAV